MSIPHNPLKAFQEGREQYYQGQSATRRFKNASKDHERRRTEHGALTEQHTVTTKEVDFAERVSRERIPKARGLLGFAKKNLNDVEERLDKVKNPYSKREGTKNALGRSNRDMDHKLGEAGRQIGWARTTARSHSR